MAVARRVPPHVPGAGLHAEPPDGAGPPQVALRRPPYRDRPLGARLAGVPPRLREDDFLLMHRLGLAALGPLLRFILQMQSA